MAIQEYLGRLNVEQGLDQASRPCGPPRPRHHEPHPGETQRNYFLSLFYTTSTRGNIRMLRNSRKLCLGKWQTMPKTVVPTARNLANGCLGEHPTVLLVPLAKLPLISDVEHTGAIPSNICYGTCRRT